MTYIRKSVSRREFIQRTASGAMGALFAPVISKVYGAHLSKTSALSRVVIVRDQNVLDAESFQDSSINQEVVQLMMDVGIKSLTGIDIVGNAWKSLFPNLTQKTVIGIKVNSLSWLMYTHPKVTNAVVAGLTSMKVEDDLFPINNIIIWDRKDSHLKRGGYIINRDKEGVRCFGTNDDYTSEKYEIEVGKKPQGISKILTEQCDYLINLSVLKNHGLAGVTLSLKNHYGTCEKPWDLHDKYCDPAISVLNSLSVIRQKQVISICDAVFGSTIDADKPPTVMPKSLIFSKDPVAMDVTGAKMLESYGAKTTSLDNMAKHIATSAKPPYNLGTCDPNNIESITIENPSSKEDSGNKK
jgi:uncharacterized protein (DUF362 family)